MPRSKPRKLNNILKRETLRKLLMLWKISLKMLIQMSMRRLGLKKGRKLSSLKLIPLLGP